MRELVWMGSSRGDLIEMPDKVRSEFGHGLHLAQNGQRHIDAKPYGSNIELIERHDGDTYRCIYNVNIGDDIYVLHAFQKKSTSGIAVPKHVTETIEARFKAAKKLAAEKQAQRKHDI